MISWFFRNRIFLFVWATITGFLFALVWKQYEQTVHDTLTYYRITPSSFDYQWAYRAWLDSQGLRSVKVQREPVTANATAATTPNRSLLTTEDKWLREKIPVLCVILAKKAKSAKAVKSTWASHCNRALFYGPFADQKIPVTKLKPRNNWNFLCQVLHGVWNGYRDELKWVLVVKDDTYAVVENLRYMVASLDHNESHYLGHAFRDYDGQYNIEDAGFTLSWGALSLLFQKYKTVEECSNAEYWHDSGRTLGKVLEESGVRPKDTRDITERARFLPFNLNQLLIPGTISIFSHYWRDSVYLSPEGSGCCSDFVVTLSDVNPNRMYMMEYLIYQLKPASHTWPPVEDNGPAPNYTPPTKSPAKPASAAKVTGKAFVAQLGNQNNKGSGGENKDKPQNGASGSNRLETKGSDSDSDDMKNEIDDGPVKKVIRNEDDDDDVVSTNQGQPIKNGHMEHEVDIAVEIGEYDSSAPHDNDSDYPEQQDNNVLVVAAEDSADERLKNGNVAELLFNSI